MPRDLLEEDIVVLKAPPKKKTGLKAVGEDILESGKNILPAAWHIAKELPGQFADIAGVTERGEYPTERARGILKSNLLKGGRGVLNIPANAVDYLRDKELVPDWLRAWRPETANKFDYDKYFGVEGQRPGDVPLAMGAQLAANPFGKAAPALWAVGQNENPIIAQAIPSLLKAAPKAVETGVNVLRNADITPSGIFAKQAESVGTPAELTENLRVSQNKPALLGDVAMSPKIKGFFENVSSEVPFSKGKKILGNIKNSLDQQGQNLLKELSSKYNIQGDSNLFVQKMLHEAYKDAKFNKNSLYDNVTKIAENEGFQLSTPKLVDTLFENINNIQASPLYLSNAKFRKAFNSLYSKMTNDEPISLAEVKTVLNDFDTMGSKLQRSAMASERFQGEMYEDLAQIGREEIRNQIAKSGIPELERAYSIADENYANNFAPLLEKDVKTFLNNPEEAHSIVVDIINPSKKFDNPAVIKKIQDLMPAGNENLLGYVYLQSAFKDGRLNINELNSLINKLGDRQFKELFPNIKSRQEVIDFAKLANMNAEARNLFFNPKTGARSIPSLVKGGIFGTAFGLFLSGQVGSALATVGIPVAAARYFNSRVASPKFREAVVKKIIKQQGKSPMTLPELPPEFYRLLGLSAFSNNEESNQ